ncbi:glycosyl hydrolase 115 family protein [Sorangium sp. So ce1389]|uniref:glycosyl hydrolase 115 family protein n=1 Tax=Sorangium sp. So ce1389 TaxID=3133336 RepID=UPI003F64368E
MTTIEEDCRASELGRFNEGAARPERSGRPCAGPGRRALGALPGSFRPMLRTGLLLGLLPLSLSLLGSCSTPDGTPPTSGGTGAQPGDPGTQPGDPGTQPGDPGTQPGDPGTQPGDPGTQPGDPGTQPHPEDPEKYVSFEPGPDSFPLVAGGKAAPLVVSASDHPGVIRVVNDLKTDIGRVTHVEPEVSLDEIPAAEDVVLIGTLGRSPLVDRLVSEKKLDVTGIEGRWETTLLQVVKDPLPGVRRAFVIAGSDQRGAIFGAYDVSRNIGVSPWHYWDDVPAHKHSELYILPGRYSQGEPKVKYRGFFINDENPALGTWARNTFGPAPNSRAPDGFDHELYAHVYEVMLRLKANYLWPAVWGRSLFDDDPESQALAAEYGIVMGTSHEAPMMRAQDEWNRHGSGQWNFDNNTEYLKKYWADGIRRMKDYESVVTVGMRGNGDLPIDNGGNIDLMQRIVQAQRQILTEVTGKEVTTIPQVWTLYKEVQNFWDDGMRAPDDVIINWCDDNWGNMRELPDLSAPPRAGGYGLYYHFDYVGGGRNYKWVDTNLLPNIWEQLHLSYRYGVDRLWMVNVGDMKNEEHPLEFFLDYAWNPERWPVERIPVWERQWAAQQFGPEHAAEIAEVLTMYSRLQSRRKPELLNRAITVRAGADVGRDPNNAIVYSDGSPFSLIHYDELERVVAEWQALAAEAERLNEELPAEYRDAYYELVLYQVKASANLYELRLAGFKNILYAAQGRAATRDMAEAAQARLADDKAMSAYYNNTLAGGKWKGFQTQPKIGYGGNYPDSGWQQPERNNTVLEDFIWPELKQINVPRAADMGVAITGSDKHWPAERTAAVLHELSPFQTQPAQHIEVFNRGQEPFDYTIEAAVAWVRVSPNSGTIEKEVRATVSVDWDAAPKGTTEVPITVKGPGGKTVVVEAVVNNPDVNRADLEGFVESNGYVSIEAEHFTRAVSADPITWQLIPHIGRTAGGMTPFPVTSPRQTPGGESPRLEYKMNLFTSGKVTVWAYLSPRNNVLHSDGLKYAVSIDDGQPQIVNVTTALNGVPMNKSWERNTSDNVNLTSTTHTIAQPGAHVLKFWMVDPTVVVQKIVVDTGGLKPSYLGPPESFRATK